MSQNLPSLFESAGQGHVFQFADELSESERAELFAQAESIDLSELKHLIENLVLQDEVPLDLTDLAPAPFIPLPGNGGDAAAWSEAETAGEEALRAGRVAAFTVAGGQGTRLGFDGPKGTFPVTPVTGNTLFQVFAEKIRVAAERYGVRIPWLIMTSKINHDATVEFFRKHDHFGLPPEDLRFFSQGLMPAVDREGKILLAEKHSIALSPDGHGGSLRALHRSGCLDFLRERGIDLISYFQVDNPLVHCLDPHFLGFHLLNGSELSSKACLKAYPEEKVGVFVTGGGSTRVLEYSDLPEDLSTERDEQGQLKYRAGSIAIHVFSRDLVERLGSAVSGDAALPFHRAFKKVSCVDGDGAKIVPTEPNGVKFEMFVFDAIPFAKAPLVVETSRQDDFSPVKNAEGNDSPETSKADQLRQFTRWAKAAGLEVETDDSGLPSFPFEVSPLYADSAAAFAERVQKAKPEISSGTVLKAPETS